MKKLLIPLIFLLSFSGFAQTNYKFTHVAKANYQYGYIEAVPTDYVAGENLPMVIAMGGVGERGDGTVSGLNKLYQAGATMLLKQGQLPLPERCIFLSPQSSDGWMNLFPQTTNSGIYKFIDFVTNKYKYDGRLILTGLSAGGANTWDYIAYHPGKVTAAVPVSHAGNPDAISNYIKVPIWAFCGKYDSYYNNNQTILKKVKDAGGEMLFTELPVGHSGWNEFYKKKEVWEWAFSKGKKIDQPEVEPEPEPEPVPTKLILTSAEVDRFIQFLQEYKTSIK